MTTSDDAQRFATRLLSYLADVQISIDGDRPTASGSLADWYFYVDECVQDLIAALHECPGLLEKKGAYNIDSTN